MGRHRLLNDRRGAPELSSGAPRRHCWAVWTWRPRKRAVYSISCSVVVE